MNPVSRWFAALALIFTALLLSLAFAGAAPPADSIRGFLPARVAAERELEQKLRAVPDPAHAESNLRHLTSHPHMAGTVDDRHVAEWLRDQYRSFGFNAEIVSYSVWIPYPHEVSLELTAPEKKTLATPEPPIAGDDDTRQPGPYAAFNAFSPSGEVTAPVVYVNYGMVEDYSELDSLGISVAGKIVIARYGRCFRGVKAKLAEEHKAAGLILYSDPQDDGYVAGDAYPRGPWRPMGGIQRGSIAYTQIYPGDPLTPNFPSVPPTKRISPADAANLPHIPTLPISAQDASSILHFLGGPHVPKGWQGGLPFTYHVGPGASVAHMKLAMDYLPRTIYDVIATLGDPHAPEWVVLGNHHDAWVYGAADPGSGTTVMLETARALGELARSGWKPRRSIIMAEWDAEEFGLFGSTEWVEEHLAELQQRAVAYINADVAVDGPNFGASATPSLNEIIRDVTREIPDPRSGRPIFDLWLARGSHVRDTPSGMPRPGPQAENRSDAPVGSLGGGSDYAGFLNHAGIPSMDLGFSGDYGVYHSLYDDFNWMKQFGDPTFAYHATMARIIGTIALRIDEADVLPFDYSSYAAEISRAARNLASRATQQGLDPDALKTVEDASGQFTASASRATEALSKILSSPLDPARAAELNRTLVLVEQDLLAPHGLVGRPWYKHTIFAPGTYAGYAPTLMPGVTEALDRDDAALLRQESDSLAAAIRRAAARLDEAARLAKP
ncbi:MAG TPA: M28 family metallopeptidase [Candidatus Limnocylindrales bacterium]|nr:M28 family metallopeptidase [Candidatus Limnocylindrales bacterium]